MSNEETKEHMSQTTVKSDSLPSLQHAIVLHLAKNEPQTINQTAKALSKDYSATHTSFKSLVSKKLIMKTGARRYREQEFECYWLTDEGMIKALIEGANADKLLQQTKKLYPEAEIAHCFLEIIPLFDPVIVRTSYSYVKGKGKLEFPEVAQLILSGAAEAMEIETAKKIGTILKKYPEQYSAFKFVVQEMITLLSQLISD
jgi:DNA-binding MarR family transcriptional regulator